MRTSLEKFRIDTTGILLSKEQQRHVRGGGNVPTSTVDYSCSYQIYDGGGSLVYNSGPGSCPGTLEQCTASVDETGINMAYMLGYQDNATIRSGCA